MANQIFPYEILATPTCFECYSQWRLRNEVACVPAKFNYRCPSKKAVSLHKPVTSVALGTSSFQYGSVCPATWLIATPADADCSRCFACSLPTLCLLRLTSQSGTSIHLGMCQALCVDVKMQMPNWDRSIRCPCFLKRLDTAGRLH